MFGPLERHAPVVAEIVRDTQWRPRDSDRLVQLVQVVHVRSTRIRTVKVETVALSTCPAGKWFILFNF